MGRKPKSIDLHLVDGNKKSRLTKSEIEARKEAEESIRPNNDKVKPPKWLSKNAKKEFKRIVKELQASKLVTNVDVDLLATYCDAYVEYQACSDIIEEEGLMVEYTNKAAETNRVPHPLLTKKKALFEQMQKVSSEFGLSPSSRAKLAMPKKEKKEDNPLDKMFGGV